MMFSAEKNFSQWNILDFNGTPAHLFETIESTHTQMKLMAAAGEIAPGALFIADKQLAGRGRHERTWTSPAGRNLYFNILVPLEGIPLATTPQITQVVALTLAETFKDLQGDTTPQQDRVTVKWPNDILCGKSKFCGILAEIVYMPGARPALNLGIGINVNSDPSDYSSIGRAVTTLKAIAGKPINRERLMQAIVGNLERALGQFKAFGISPWVQAWRKMDQFIGARGTIIVSKKCTDQNRDGGEGVQKKSGRILDMQPDGSLLFETDDGDVQTVYSADLEI
ncbi:MAG: biotin--[acetyl-CoA-carboxylase] ligase [Fibrobacter sp.]|nr:biotin--[acetyl-CoA-carboxylase] ligase [Fibrobacter sp.]